LLKKWYHWIIHPGGKTHQQLGPVTSIDVLVRFEIGVQSWSALIDLSKVGVSSVSWEAQGWSLTLSSLSAAILFE